jgi:hypothetical protein
MKPPNRVGAFDLLRRIIEIVTHSNHPILERDIKRALKGRNQAKVLALRLLVAEKAIERLGSGVNRDPFRYACPVSTRERGSHRFKEDPTPIRISSDFNALKFECRRNQLSSLMRLEHYSSEPCENRECVHHGLRPEFTFHHNESPKTYKGGISITRNRCE